MAGVVVVLGLAVLFVRRPGWFVLAVIFTLPFRIPVPTGNDDTASLLLPALRRASPRACWRTCGACRGARLEDVLRDDPRARRVLQALAIVVVLYALQALYSSDLEHAVKTLGFFYVPFAVMMRLLVELRWSRRLCCRRWR